MATNNVYNGRLRWTEDMEDLLVDCWQQYECLYNVSSDTFHNKVEKERCWEEIAVALDLPVLEVKVRATTLRTQYSRLLKPPAVRSSGRKNKAQTPRQKRILSSLQFLRKHVVSRSPDSNLDQSTKARLNTLQDSGDDIKPEHTAFSLDHNSGRSRSPAKDAAAVRTTWSVEKEDQLLELWQQHDCLYDMSTLSADRFYDRMEREKKWAEIAATLKLPVEDVKIRASSLRTQYSRLVKPLSSGRTKGSLTPRQRKILTSCQFLKKHINHRFTEGNPDQSIKGMLRSRQNSSDSGPENAVRELSQDLGGEMSPSPTETSSVSPPPQLANKQKKPPYRNDEERQKVALLQQILDVFQETSREAQKDCEDSFGVTIALELKRIQNPALRNRVKRQIMTILYDALDSEQVTEPESYQPRHMFPREEPHSITVVIP